MTWNKVWGATIGKEYQVNKDVTINSDVEILLVALGNIFQAVQKVRDTEDALIRAKGTDDYEDAANAYEDAHASLIICENEAKRAIDRCREMRAP